MEEIITRWATDLSKYQKEFQSQAEKVAKWDASIVENTDKINKLYSKTFQAERDAAEVERQLRTMEENQNELDQFLDRYETEVENMLKMSGVNGHGGRGDGFHGPDQERERTYKLAEKLQDKLNELNKDLTEMIEEINTTSQTLSKTGKPDDPVSFSFVGFGVWQGANCSSVDQGRSCPQHAALAAPAHRCWSLAAAGEDRKGAEREPAHGRQWVEWLGFRRSRRLHAQLQRQPGGAVLGSSFSSISMMSVSGGVLEIGCLERV